MISSGAIGRNRARSHEITAAGRQRPAGVKDPPGRNTAEFTRGPLAHVPYTARITLHPYVMRARRAQAPGAMTQPQYVKSLPGANR